MDSQPTRDDRYRQIIAAYEEALDGRDPHDVDIFDLLPAIFDAVPNVNTHEIAAALRQSADEDQREADSLRRYGNARSSVGKQTRPGDGTIPFRRSRDGP